MVAVASVPDVGAACEKSHTNVAVWVEPGASTFPLTGRFTAAAPPPEWTTSPATAPTGAPGVTRT